MYRCGWSTRISAVVNSQPTSTDGEPARPLQRMFNAVPRRYDLLNRVLTFGLDEPWRALAARRLLEGGGQGRVLDLCCGTGDLALRIARQAGAGVRITGVDFSPAMLERARRKAQRAGAAKRIEFIEGDASALPFDSASYDAVGTAFAFRNVTWRNHLRDGVLAEVLRVLRPGGRFVIVETSQPSVALMRWGMHAYLRLIAAPLGTWVSGHPSAYRYLAESACNYYSADEVREMLLGAGFADVSYTRLLTGVAAVHVAVR